MDVPTSQCRVLECSTSKCQEKAVYHCFTCQYSLCDNCKENHLLDLNNIEHVVKNYHWKFDISPKKENCVTHPGRLYSQYCYSCQVPFCGACSEHKMDRFPLSLFRQSSHRLQNIQMVYAIKRQQCRKIISIIRGEALFYSRALLSKIKPEIEKDIETCHEDFTIYRFEMLKKARILKENLDNVLTVVDSKYRCLNPKIRTFKHLAKIQQYEHVYEQSSIRPVQFIKYIKETCLPSVNDNILSICSQMHVNELLNKTNIIQLLCEIQITQAGIRRVGNDRLLNWMPKLTLLKQFKIDDLDCCNHAVFVNSNRVWVCDTMKLVLSNQRGDTLHTRYDIGSFLKCRFGIHTVNGENELLYINADLNISKLSKDRKTSRTVIMIPDPAWHSQCLHWAPSTGDVLVAMLHFDTHESKVNRYNHTGQLTQTIQLNPPNKETVVIPFLITENSNRDIVVAAAFEAVIVKDYTGKHRFSYSRDRKGSEVWPIGLCVDALAHILVSDAKSKAVYMLDKNGRFLLYLLSSEKSVFKSISYDVNTHRLLVSTAEDNTVSVYSYITRMIL